MTLLKTNADSIFNNQIILDKIVSLLNNTELKRLGTLNLIS